MCLSGFFFLGGMWHQLKEGRGGGEGDGKNLLRNGVLSYSWIHSVLVEQRSDSMTAMGSKGLGRAMLEFLGSQKYRARLSPRVISRCGAAALGSGEIEEGELR